MPPPVTVTGERLPAPRSPSSAMRCSIATGTARSSAFAEAPVPIVRIRGTITARRRGDVARNVVALGAKAGCRRCWHGQPAEAIRRLLEESGIEDHAAVSDLGTHGEASVIGRRRQMLRVDLGVKPNSDVLAGRSACFRELLEKVGLGILVRLWQRAASTASADHRNRARR